MKIDNLFIAQYFLDTKTVNTNERYSNTHKIVGITPSINPEEWNHIVYGYFSPEELLANNGTCYLVYAIADISDSFSTHYAGEFSAVHLFLDKEQANDFATTIHAYSNFKNYTINLNTKTNIDKIPELENMNIILPKAKDGVIHIKKEVFIYRDAQHRSIVCQARWNEILNTLDEVGVFEYQIPLYEISAIISPKISSENILSSI